MSKNKKIPLGVVYSTDSNFEFSFEDTSIDTLEPNKQVLRVQLDKKARAGKQVTLITGFEGQSSDLEALGKKLKNLCGAGGSAKDNEILIQGDFRDKILKFLIDNNYSQTKRIG